MEREMRSPLTTKTESSQEINMSPMFRNRTGTSSTSSASVSSTNTSHAKKKQTPLIFDSSLPPSSSLSLPPTMSPPPLPPPPLPPPPPPPVKSLKEEQSSSTVSPLQISSIVKASDEASLTPTKKAKLFSSGGSTNNSGKSSGSGSGVSDTEVLRVSKGDSSSKESAGSLDKKFMYHKTHLSTEWMYSSIVMHILQFSLLLGVGVSAIPLGSAVMISLLVVIIVLILVAARCKTKKAVRVFDWAKKAVSSPDQETDDVTDAVIYLLSAAVILECIAYALYPVSAYDFNSIESNTDSIIQILCFAAIINLSFHRIIRPANRLDPLRTILELEITNICWDALDGASLFALVATTEGLSNTMVRMVRFLMSFWYLSIGFRQAMMYCAHLSPDSWVYSRLLPPAAAWSSEPTVDRTLGAIAFRTKITVTMALSHFFAAGLRINLWKNGRLDSLQQEMMVKNILYLAPTVGAVMKYYATSGRYWNSRVVLNKPIPFLNCRIFITKPQRSFQIEIVRYIFVITYLIVGAMFSSFLTSVTDESFFWICNVATDIICMLMFLFLCRAVHKPKAHIIFPKRLAGYLSVLLIFNLFAARIPSLYLNVDKMEKQGEFFSYENALLIVLVSIVPISSYGFFWSLSNMVFHSEFTACPGNMTGTIASYNGIHDPSITLVSTQTMLDGALDIVSTSALLSLALEGLPDYLNYVIIFCAFLEVLNACQCFVIQVILSGGHEDTPANLVLLRSKLRLLGGWIDFCVFCLRLTLWLKFNAESSVFMVKNLSSLLHTLCLIERGMGVEKYSQNTLFMEYVMPQDWYGMSVELWRKAIRMTSSQENL